MQTQLIYFYNQNQNLIYLYLKVVTGKNCIDYEILESDL